MLACLIIDIEQFLPIEEFYQESEIFIQHVKSSPAAEGFDEILLPGEIESKVKRQRTKEGIFVEDETWEQILEWGQKFGVELKWNLSRNFTTTGSVVSLFDSSAVGIFQRPTNRLV